jgi:putative DNA primase/helicase
MSTQPSVDLSGIFPEHSPDAEFDSFVSEPMVAVERLNAMELQGAQADNWPEPEPIRDSLPDVAVFDLELMPESLRPMVSDIAHRVQVPLDFPAVAVVVTLAGLTNRRAMIQPKALDNGWVVVPNLWGGIVAPPGMSKSPVISAVTKLATAIESAWRSEDAGLQRVYDDALELHEAEVKAWKAETQSALKVGNAIPLKPECRLVAPVPRRLMTNDATFEALHRLLAETPAGLFVLRDELTGWLAGLEKQGREQERAFFLECWNGDASFTMDRITRGTIHVPHACVSLFGGIQPARLRSYMADAIKDGPSNDGLIQRFQLLVWPDAPEEWKYVDSAPDQNAQRAAESVYRRLAGMDVASPLRLKFARDAQTLFVDFLTDLENRIRGNELSPAMKAHLSKYRSLMPSLALLFTLADGQTDCVPLEQARRAAAWCDYLETHGRRVYASASPPEQDAARTMARYLAKGWKAREGRFTLRDVYRNQWIGLGKTDEARKALEVLLEWEWVRLATSGEARAAGRPSEVYLRNPRIEVRHAT